MCLPGRCGLRRDNHTHWPKTCRQEPGDRRPVPVSALLGIKAPGTGVCLAGPMRTSPESPTGQWRPATDRARIPPPTQSAQRTESTVTARRLKAVRKHGGDTNMWKGLTINTLSMTFKGTSNCSGEDQGLASREQ